jgi:hypothetical protein
MKTHELARKLLEYPDLPLKMGRTEIVWISDITSDERDIEEPIKYLVIGHNRAVITNENYYCVGEGEEKIDLS